MSPIRLTRGGARRLGIAAPGVTTESLPRPELSDTLLAQMRMIGLPEPKREVRFHPTRKWRFDLAYPNRFIAIECEGQSFGSPDEQSRHTSHAGFRNDCDKYNFAALAGWKVLRFTTDHIKSGRALRTIEEALKTWPEVR
jgi:hypothetical protein